MYWSSHSTDMLSISNRYDDMCNYLCLAQSVFGHSAAWLLKIDWSQWQTIWSSEPTESVKISVSFDHFGGVPITVYITCAYAVVAIE